LLDRGTYFLFCNKRGEAEGAFSGLYRNGSKSMRESMLWTSFFSERYEVRDGN
jgi:hypothetical protein